MQIYMYIALYCDARIAVLRVLLLFIGIIPNPNPILPWTSCLELEKLLQFSTSVIFFSSSPFWASVLKQRKWVLFIFCPSYWTVNFKKYLFKISTSVPADLVGHLWSLGWRAYCWCFENGSLSNSSLIIYLLLQCYLWLCPHLLWRALSVLWKRNKNTINV